MSEPDHMSCDDFGGAAAEFSLGVLTGRERARAVAHLDDCESCREHVRQLSLTGEEMLALLPAREPPAGFESRVMDRIGVAVKPERPNWSRRMLTLAAVALAVVACVVGGWGLRGAMAPPSGVSTAQAPLREAALLTAAHRPAGKVYLYDGNPHWLYMGVDTHASSSDTVVCQLVVRGGRVIVIGSFRLDGGYGAWGSPDPVAASDVTGARITAMDGTVLASASFPTGS
ncbi:MAG TPA: hypothetical protein VGD68_00695 [Streptosporangiaceae bacterium]